MDIFDEYLQHSMEFFKLEKQRIPVTTAKYQKEVDDAEKELNAAIAAGDKRLIYGYKDILKHAKYELSSYNEHASFLREPTKEDIQYRFHQRKEFPKKIENLSDDKPFCFHGTDIKGAKQILLSGEISSGADRTGRSTSYDPPGRISVTNKDTVDTSVGIYMNMDGNFCYPAGCLFVVLPADRAEYDNLSSGWMIKNVNFRAEPDRLVSVVTTPENLEKLKGWAEKSGVDKAKIMDFDAFVHKYSPQKDKKLSLDVQKSIMAKGFEKR